MTFDVCFKGSSFTEGFITVRANVTFVPICSFCFCLLERKWYNISRFVLLCIVSIAVKYSSFDQEEICMVNRKERAPLCPNATLKAHVKYG